VIWLQHAGAAIFAILGLVAVMLTPLGVPGAWMVIGIAGTVDVTAMMFGGTQPPPFGLAAFAIAVSAAAVGEVLEFIAGALGAKAGGASRAGMAGSMVGGIAGVIVGTVLLPVPLLGSIIGALAGVALGAVVGEVAFHGRTAVDSVRPAFGATVGRVIGSLAKLPCALVAWIALVYEAFT
jgi:uncharacterized protein YqgC (DUF456 family)